MSQLEDSVYDDQDAVKFIQNSLPQELKGKFTDDDIVYITDVIYEFYESQGLLDDDIEEDEAEVDLEDILEYVMKNSKRDGFKFVDEEVRWVINGEFDYEESLD
ncbi:MAG: hypothetical protein Q4F97_02335 [Bacteroidales bacterium]|nr:hypothetical protein [Bacteroidales bacterium]